MAFRETAETSRISFERTKLDSPFARLSRVLAVTLMPGTRLACWCLSDPHHSEASGEHILRRGLLRVALVFPRPSTNAPVPSVCPADGTGIDPALFRPAFHTHIHLEYDARSCWGAREHHCRACCKLAADMISLAFFRPRRGGRERLFFSIAHELSPQLLGSCLSCVTCGMLLSLVARYWAIFGGDAWYVRAAVVLSAVYAFADTAINCTWAYRVSTETSPVEVLQLVLTLSSVQWAVSDFLRPADLMQLPWQVTSFCIWCVRPAE